MQPLTRTIPAYCKLEVQNVLRPESDNELSARSDAMLDDHLDRRSMTLLREALSFQVLDLCQKAAQGAQHTRVLGPVLAVLPYCSVPYLDRGDDRPT